MRFFRDSLLTILVVQAMGANALAQSGGADVPLSNVKAMALGTNHSCALSEGGAVACWGSNSSGQLGAGVGPGTGVPQNVIGLQSGVQSLAAGYNHTCAATAQGRVKCWGANFYGALGDGSTERRSTPVEVAGITDAVSVVAGGGTSCALLATGGVKCWGGNGAGEMGIGHFDYDAHPVPEGVNGLSSGVVALAMGDSHVCALVTNGAVLCWGWNRYGQLGDETQLDRAVPVAMTRTPSEVVALSLGKNHSCVLDRMGAVSCWGDGAYRGDGGASASFGPVAAIGLDSGVKRLASGYLHSCAITSADAVKCWGLNDAGQLGDGSLEYRGTPVATALTGGVRDVYTGIHHSCAILVDGSAHCWGGNVSDQLGNRKTTLQAAVYPVIVPSLQAGITQIAAGSHHTCAANAGGVHCWGYNDGGQLGTAHRNPSASPLRIAGLDVTVRELGAGRAHSCALSGDGWLRCWGNNAVGQLGDGTTLAREGPVAVQGLAGAVVSFAIGGSHSCALLTNGRVQCWGDNSFGALGDGTGINRPAPTEAFGLRNIGSIGAGSGHSCAANTQGAVFCWGSNHFGQVGDGSMIDRYSPIAVPGLAGNVRRLAAGDFHTCALSSDGEVYCWGANDAGQLGFVGEASLYPRKVTGLDGKAVSLAAGARHNCVILADGESRCWGGYGGAQVGALGTQMRPVPVPGLPKLLSISAGESHTCGLSESGQAWCWGGNAWGELGRGVFGFRVNPQPVLLAAAVEIFEFQNSALGHYFITGGAGEIAGIEAGAAGPGWSRTGLSFQAYAPETGIAPGALPVCRFYGTPGRGPNSHFYTVDSTECELVKQDPGWTYEGIALYIFFPPVDDQCAAGTQPVYRAYNMRFAQNDSNHRYTTDAAVYAQMQAQGWAGEGVKFCGAQ